MITRHISRIARRAALAAHVAQTASTKAEPQVRESARRRIAQLLGDARGIAMKLGQLSAGTDATDPMYVLTQSAPPLPFALIADEIGSQLERPWRTVLQEIDPEGRAASLGQVHRARLLDGTEVALKVRYPEIAETVDAELALLELMPGIGPVKKWGFDLSGYKRVLRDSLRRELDYRLEATTQQHFAAALGVPGLIVPEVRPDLTTDGLLVQRWEPGVPFSEVLTWSTRERERVAAILLATLLASLFRTGLVHADPHPGNVAFRRGVRGAEVVLYDYGSMLSLSPAVRLGLLRCLIDAREGARTEPSLWFEQAGFDGQKLALIQTELFALRAQLCEPFLNDGRCELAEFHPGERIRELLGDSRWWFRAAGPPELLLALRALQGTFALLSALDVRLPCWEILCAAVERETLSAARTLRPRSPAATWQARPGDARLLKVRVTTGHTERALISMPARAALELPDIVPEDVVEALRGDVDLGALSEQLAARGLAPQVLFERTLGERRYRVWLE